MNIYYQEQNINQVFSQFVKGYRLPPGTKLAKWEATFDPRTEKVIFKLFVTAPLGGNGNGMAVTPEVDSPTIFPPENPETIQKMTKR